VLAVLATKIRSNGEASVATAIGKAYEGFLISEPVVGRGMVIFRDPNGRRMVTTMVRRILTTEQRSCSTSRPRTASIASPSSNTWRRRPTARSAERPAQRR
jgi:hypothetical protein